MNTAARVSVMAQTIDYLIAMTGPLAVGAIYQRMSDWNLPIVMLAAILVIQLFVSLPVGRDVKM